MIATLIGIAVVGVFSVLYWQLTADMELRLQNRVLEQRDAIVAAADQNDLSALTEAVENEARSVRDGDAIFLLTDKNGAWRAGNVEQSPGFKGWRTLGIDGQVLSLSPVSSDSFLAIWTSVGDTRLLVGRSWQEVSRAQSSLWKALLAGLLTTIGLAFGIGVISAMSAQRKITALAETLAAVSKGQLAARAALTGSGDDLDFVASHLNGALVRLERSVERINQSSTDIAHDLKRPIGRLRQRLEASARRARPEVRDEILEAVEDIDSIVDTFEALLSLSQIEAGARRVHFKPVDVAALLRDIAAIYGPVAEDAGHFFKADIAANCALKTNGDADLLLQLFANIIENAIQHCPSPNEIGVIAKANASGEVHVEVADHGSGIPASEREKVFNRLYRLDKSRRTPGNGLGLSIVKAIAEMHGASIELADNDPGLRVIVRLPRV